MTIMNGQDNLNVYVGDGVTAGYPVIFTFRKVGDIKVSRRGTLATVLLTIDTDYSITGDGLAGEAIVVLVAVPAFGEKVIIERKVAARQEQGLSDLQEFPAAEVEKTLDDMARQIGDVQRRLKRAIVGDIEDEEIADLPQASERIDKLLSFDDEGTFELLAKNDFKGDPGVINASGTLAGRSAYDNEAPPFTYLATDQTPKLLFVRETAAPGVWSPGIPYGRGELGDVMRRDWGNAVAAVPTNLIDASILSGMMPFGLPVAWPYAGDLPDARFIELWGGTIGKAGSGAAYTGDDLRDYYALCKNTPSFGNTGTENFDALDTVKTLDMRGVPFIGLDRMAENTRNLLQQSTTISTTAGSPTA